MAAPTPSKPKPSSADILMTDLQALHEKLSTAKASSDKYRLHMSDASKSQKSATGKYEEFRKELKSLTQAFRKSISQSKKLSSATSSSSSSEFLTNEQVTKAEETLEEAKELLDEVDQIRGSTGSIFVRLFLGQVNVKAASQEDRMTLREEYDKFKTRTNWGFIIFPLIWIGTSVYLRHSWRYTHWIHILTHVWLLYYYVSLSLRENILRVNGSHIRPWWIYHHYVSSCMSIVVLTWPPDSRSWDRFTPTFTAYFLYQGGVQFIQALYQSRRHYALRALGKASEMDVKHTETLTEFHAGLYAIIGFVFVAQAWQIYNGIALLQVLIVELNVSLPWYEFREEVQCGLLGCMFIFLGITNFIVTVQTLLAKSSKEREQRARAEKRRAAALTAAAAVAQKANATAGGGGDGHASSGLHTSNASPVPSAINTFSSSSSSAIPGASPSPIPRCSLSLTDLLESLREIVGPGGLSLAPSGSSVVTVSAAFPPSSAEQQQADGGGSSSSVVANAASSISAGSGILGGGGSVDAIVYPSTHEQLTAVVLACATRNVHIIPRNYGANLSSSNSNSVLSSLAVVNPHSSSSSSSSVTTNQNNSSNNYYNNVTNASSSTSKMIGVIVLDTSRLAVGDTTLPTRLRLPRASSDSTDIGAAASASASAAAVNPKSGANGTITAGTGKNTATLQATEHTKCKEVQSPRATPPTTPGGGFVSPGSRFVNVMDGTLIGSFPAIRRPTPIRASDSSTNLAAVNAETKKSN